MREQGREEQGEDMEGEKREEGERNLLGHLDSGVTCHLIMCPHCVFTCLSIFNAPRNFTTFNSVLLVHLLLKQ